MCKRCLRPCARCKRACPLPEAEKAIEELETIDPEAVRRAKTFFPIPVPVRSKPGEDTTSQSVSPGTTLRTGTRLAAVAPVLRTDRAADQLGRGAMLAATTNPWDLGYVVTIALASIILALFLVLTGGPATGVIPVVVARD